ncbi:hypothetical protein ALC53_09616 [Atta colombica]|uniref:Uncharacterized protein n=1 Tax=Atta colombica TaxID=520822 RepID=A0A151I187_9HYME|nr:hypothetical protein ALC53_09616 [Atta colombica]
MPEDRAWRILRVFPDISESLIIHFMEISPTGKARLENAARSLYRKALRKMHNYLIIGVFNQHCLR